MESQEVKFPLETKFDQKLFHTLLHVDKDNAFTLNLSGCTLIECIDKMCEIKKHSHPNLRKNYNMCIHQIQLLEKEYDCTITPSIVNSLFWSMFVPYLANRGLKYSTIKTVVGEILSTLNWSSKYSVKLSPSYSEVEIPKYKSTQIALTSDEISYIYHFKLDDTKIWSDRYNKWIKMKKNKINTLKRVRDMFVLSCNLGQRHSDMLRIKPEYFKNGVFSMIQQKTGNRCYVNLDKMTIDRNTTYAILERYNYTAPYPGEIANYNHYLKELLILIGDTFFKDVNCENKINGVVVAESKPKFKMVSSHTARRTFATINTIRNYPRHSILRATGHKTEESFIHYICYEEDDFLKD